MVSEKQLEQRLTMKDVLPTRLRDWALMKSSDPYDYLKNYDAVGVHYIGSEKGGFDVQFAFLREVPSNAEVVVDYKTNLSTNPFPEGPLRGGLYNHVILSGTALVPKKAISPTKLNMDEVESAVARDLLDS